MTYIFDLLHQNHRFEMLLRKKVESVSFECDLEKVNDITSWSNTVCACVQNVRLKTALLDYIKRCLPGDSEKHNMVALCFSMCREIGENHEAAARTQLKIIQSQPWGERNFIYNMKRENIWSSTKLCCCFFLLRLVFCEKQRSREIWRTLWSRFWLYWKMQLRATRRYFFTSNSLDYESFILFRIYNLISLKTSDFYKIMCQPGINNLNLINKDFVFCFYFNATVVYHSEFSTLILATKNENIIRNVMN